MYHINFYNGIVLVNGSPPTRLPREILNHKKYSRSFGDKDFEIVKLVNGTLQTPKPIDKHYIYTFFAGRDSVIGVWECDQDENTTLELLDGNEVDKWACNVPVWVKKMHSHWYNASSRVILFRDTKFDCRSVHWMLYVDTGVMVEVPQHARQWSTSRLAEHSTEFRQLKLYDNVMLDNVLTRMDSKQYLYCITRNDRLYLEMPRFDLKFELIDGLFQCDSIRGYHLTVQGDSYYDSHALPLLTRYNQYIVLHKNDDAFEIEGAEVVILMPIGAISDSYSDPQAQIDDAYDVHPGYYRYDWHRWLNILKANNVSARLHLANVYASISLLLPNPTTHMTGVEMACMYVKQCWQNKPLTNEEEAELKNLRKYASKSPLLDMLVVDLFVLSNSLNVLHPVQHDNKKQLCHASLATMDARTAYTLQQRELQWPSRSCMTVIEDMHMMAMHIPTAPSYHRFISQSIVPPSPAPCDDTYINATEQLINDVLHEEPSSHADKAFPLNRKGHTKLGQEMMDDLVQSFELYQELPHIALPYDRERLCLFIAPIRERVSALYDETYNYIMTCLDLSSSDDHGLAWRIAKCTGRVPTANLIDLTRIVCGHEQMCTFNPFVTVSNVESAVLTLLQLAVLSDRLERIIKSMRNLIKELGCIRTWNVRLYPKWLAFEMEQRIQIRPQQAQIAFDLLNNKGSVIQLNMGEGKTRVVMPMLVAAAADGHHIVRMHVLTALYYESYQYFNNTLCASVLGIRVACIPYNREVAQSLTVTDAKLLVSTLKHVMKFGGCLLTPPEWRLSLELNICERLKNTEDISENEQDQDLIDAKRLAITLAKVRQLPFCDIVDECDLVLHHNWQLVYSMGAPHLLPSLYSRLNALHSIFRAIYQLSVGNRAKDSQMYKLLNNNDFAVFDPSPSACGFPSIRLLQESTDKSFYTFIVKQIYTDPVFEVKWISDENIDDVVRFVTDIETNPDSIIKIQDMMQNDHYEVLLALRGWLGFGILSHCMQRRHRVDYCVPGGRKKRVAVPYKANDFPADRAEFGHPDVGITYTALSYMYTGLDKTQVTRAFTVLMSDAVNQRKAIYNE